MEDSKVTILTPTYNRASYLGRLYNSLISQSDSEFVWMIVDDGSTDNTKEIVDALIDEMKIKIIYIHKENGGKHTAINLGVDMIETPYVFIVDSDDYITDKAIEFINNTIQQGDIESDLYCGFAGTRCKSDDGNDASIIGGFPGGKIWVDAKNTQRREFGLLGDKAEIYKTSHLKTHKFPIFNGEKFIPESVVWNQLAIEGYVIRWYKTPLIVCNYLEDGLTNSSKELVFFEKNIKGYTEEYKLLWEGLKIPYNYMSVSVYYNKCRRLGRHKECLSIIDANVIQKIAIRSFAGARRIRDRLK